jgi:dTDP-4-dehydrorhamnose reductase
VGAAEGKGGAAVTGRWLLTGAGGMLGRDLAAVLTAADRPLTALARLDLDITDPVAVRAAVAGHSLVINTAAWTDVDGAEGAEAAATAVNGGAVGHLAAACAATGARLVQLSTDYIFAGRAATPYPEDAAPEPINAYGRSKLAGERAVLTGLPQLGYVVRTAWLYGAHGRNFVTTMLRLAATRETIDVVDDQVGQPTWSYALAGQLAELGARAEAGTAPAGIYHGTASGIATWYELARAVFAAAALDPDRIRPTTSDRFRSPTPRPSYSVLGHDGWRRAGMRPLPDWRPMLAEAFASRDFTAAAVAARQR